jgi:hypothetical protein
MSTLQVQQLNGIGVAPTSTGLLVNNSVNMVNRTVFNYPGRMIQMQNVRYDGFTSYYARNSGNGTTIGALSLPITPIYSNSLLIMEWFIYFEMQHDAVFVIHQNDSLITQSGYQGYNNVQGNQRWSGFCPVPYDGDENSTPQQVYICYAITAGDTSYRRYAPAIRTSDGNDNRPFYLNRTVAVTTSTNYEMGVSFGTIMEIAQ